MANHNTTLKFSKYFPIKVIVFAPQVFVLACASAQNSVQTPTPITPTQKIDSITIEGKAAPVLEPERAEVGGFGGVPVRALAQSVSVLSKDALNESGVNTLSQMTRLDASLTDAYNTTGYNQSLSVRGFLLDNVYNFRRDGLPVLDIGPLALENKSQIEVLKGVSGMLSGVSAPGGLINSVTKRAPTEWARGAQLSVGERGSLGAALDVGGRIAPQWSAQFNASANTLRPEIHDAKGLRHFASAAFDYALSAHTKLSLDLEWQRFKQPSVPAVSPLDRNGDGIGDTLPMPQPRLNLNAQPWTQPFEANSSLAALKFAHRLNDAWHINAAAQRQRVRTNDRTAFPDGCSNEQTYVYPGFCGNGDFDLYDFRSDYERRTLDVFDVHARGTVAIANLPTTLTFGVQQRNFTQRTQAQAYNYAGSGNIYGPIGVVPPAPEQTVAGTDLDDRSTELYANAHIALSPQLAAFAGVRSTRIERRSLRTDGSEGVEIKQTITTPWLGLSYALTPALNLYASWGQGAESEFVPNRPTQYSNYGAALPPLKSQQTEIGAKWLVTSRLLFTAAAFEIKKPSADDRFVADALATRVAGEKEARHRGIELTAAGKLAQQWSAQASVALLDATFTRALDEALVGRRVTNVPRIAGTLFLDFQPQALPGFGVNALLSAHARKAVTADNALEIAGGTQLDLGVRYSYVGSGQRVTWRLNVENATDRVAWREAPTQSWGGIYLFTTPPRTVRASVSVEW